MDLTVKLVLLKKKINKFDNMLQQNIKLAFYFTFTSVLALLLKTTKDVVMSLKESKSTLKFPENP